MSKGCDLVCLGKIWSYPTQRAISRFLYKNRSRPIVIQCQHIQSNLLFLYFCPSFLVSFSFSSIRSISHRFNLQSCHGSRISTIQTPLGQRRSTLSQSNDTLDCRRSQQNQSARFLKVNCLVSTVLNRGLRFLFVSCGNTFLVTPLGNPLLQPCQA
jgi:hypothetical protein